MHKSDVMLPTEPDGRAILVSADSTDPRAFVVVVGDPRSESRHRVTISPQDAARFVICGAQPERCIEAAMRFLLDREPKESILATFDIADIRRYFPEFDDVFPEYLARLGGGASA